MFSTGSPDFISAGCSLQGVPKLAELHACKETGIQTTMTNGNMAITRSTCQRTNCSYDRTETLFYAFRSEHRQQPVS